METYSVNAMGTCSLLEALRQSRAVNVQGKLVLINVTTDKVYENRESLKPYQESDRLGGFDPTRIRKPARN